MTVWIGTSGWQYRHWRGPFYPPEEPVRRWLELYAALFATVESNSAFYRLPARRTFEGWADRRGVQTPLWRTTDWTYLRFHEGRAVPRPAYGRTALEAWAHRLADRWSADEECFVYFNNDWRSCAPRDAARFAHQVERVGLR